MQPGPDTLAHLHARAAPRRLQMTSLKPRSRASNCSNRPSTGTAADSSGGDAIAPVVTPSSASSRHSCRTITRARRWARSGACIFRCRRRRPSWCESSPARSSTSPSTCASESPDVRPVGVRHLVERELPAAVHPGGFRPRIRGPLRHCRRRVQMLGVLRSRRRSHHPARDPAIGIAWPVASPVLSRRDALRRRSSRCAKGCRVSRRDEGLAAVEHVIGPDSGPYAPVSIRVAS